MRELIVPPHAIARYRERVSEDNESQLRSSIEIKFLIEFSLYNSGSVQKPLRDGYHALTRFFDPFTGKQFGNYYIVLNNSRKNDGKMVCLTIKSREEYDSRLALLDDVFSSAANRRTRRARKKEKYEKYRDHYSKYCNLN